MDSRIWSSKFNFYWTDNTADGSEIPLRDTINKYEFNSTNFRGHEHGGKDILIAGCSQTFGEGVPFETIWGSKLSKLLGYEDYANIGIRSASIMAVVTRVFAYIEKYDNPKYIFCLFPNFNRIEYYIEPDISVSKWNMGKSGAYPIHLPSRTDNRDKYLKSPISIQDSLSPGFAEMIGMDHIRMLDLYCRSNEINFLWSTWDSDFLMTYDKYPEKMASYLSLSNVLSKLQASDDRKDVDCHKELFEIYGENFFIGADRICDPLEHGHLGIHKHAHIAEEFFKFLH